MVNNFFGTEQICVANLTTSPDGSKADLATSERFFSREIS